MSHLFIRALKGEPVERFPVWLMRQAGRYMPQYRELRKKVSSFLEFCSNVKLATEVTLLPQHLLGVDALILFSDILVPLIPLGIEVKFVPGEGPLLNAPSPEGWKPFNPDEVSYVYETIREVKKLSDLPLIGFAGAPFTLGAYIVEGKTSRDFKEIRKLYHSDRETFDATMTKLVEMLKIYLTHQVKAGVDAVQLFDSWAYTMSPSMFEYYANKHLRKLFEYLKEEFPSTPVIYFFRGSGHLYPAAKRLPVDALSIDWTLELEKALREIPDKALQGNMDPTILYADEETVVKETRKLLNTVALHRKSRYVFNLGHGLAPDMELQKVKLLVETVKGFKLS